MVISQTNVKGIFLVYKFTQGLDLLSNATEGCFSTPFPPGFHPLPTPVAPVLVGKYFDTVTHAQYNSHLDEEWTWLTRHEWISSDYWRYFLQFHLDVWDTNMFHNRRAHADIKKTTQKFLDPKRDSHGRLRALRTLLGRCTCTRALQILECEWPHLCLIRLHAPSNSLTCAPCSSDIFDASDSKIFFTSHYSEIFYVFHDVFSVVEANLKARGECFKYWHPVLAIHIGHCTLQYLRALISFPVAMLAIWKEMQFVHFGRNELNFCTGLEIV